MNIRTIRCAALALLAAAWLAGCGGGGGDASVPDGGGGNLPPASASASTDGMVAYAALLAKATSDTAPGVDLSAYVPPDDASDTATAITTPNDGAGL